MLLVAAWITCGLQKGISHQDIYQETKWGKARRQEEAAVPNHPTPDTTQPPQVLVDLVPPSLGERNEYTLRDQMKLISPKTTARSHHESF